MNPRNPSKPESKLIAAVEIDSDTRFQLNLATCWNLVMWALIMFKGLDGGVDGVFGVYAFVTTISYFLQLKNNRQLFNHRAKPVAEEVGNNESARACLELEDSPNSFKVNRKSELFKHQKVANVSWTIGEGTLYNHLQGIYGLFDRIEKKTNSRLLPEFPIIGRKPSSLHCSRTWDFASKGRAIGLTGVPGFLAGRALGLLKINSFAVSNVLISGYIFVSFLMSQKESTLLNTLESRLKLEGYTFRYGDYCSCPPTCIGQEARRKIVFYPHNSTILGTLDYLYDCETVVRNLKKQPNFLARLDKWTQNAIMHFDFKIHVVKSEEEDACQVFIETDEAKSLTFRPGSKR